ncbi:MAG: hypothetical protein HY010_21115 [Acidobacteria bacterium]|nr:hypothetical protein [Acidobacteriota bacterium]
MTAKFVNRSFALSVAATLFLLLGQSFAADVKNRAPEVRLLEGTWTVQVSIVDCTSGQTLGNPFPSLLTFARGGALTETTANPAFFPAERGPGHGVWAYDHHAFTAVSTAFITSNGVLVKTQKIAQAIQMGNDGNQFTSTATVSFFDPNGNLLASGCAVATAQRFK